MANFSLYKDKGAFVFYCIICGNVLSAIWVIQMAAPPWASAGHFFRLKGSFSFALSPKRVLIGAHLIGCSFLSFLFIIVGSLPYK